MLALLAASLILHDGRVFIGPGRYADAVAVEGALIVKVGDDQSVLALRGPDTKVVDLKGRAVTPGFHDAHVKLTTSAAAGAFARGVTSLHGPLDAADLEALKSLEPSPRLFGWGSLDDPAGTLRLRERAAPRILVTGAAAELDGDFENRAAALLEPYSDDPKNIGQLRYNTTELETRVKKARLKGLQPVLRAVGDRAVRQALEACAPKSPPKKPLPNCRIEGVEAAHPEDLPYFRREGAFVSVQPARMLREAEADNPYPSRLGERQDQAFPLRSLERAGATLAFGTGWASAPAHPRANVYAASARRHRDDRPAGGWIPQEKIGVEWAVTHHTLGAARAAGRGDLGVIEAGRAADLAVWDRDFLSLVGPALLEAEIDLTVLDGKVVYSRHGE